MGKIRRIIFTWKTLLICSLLVLLALLSLPAVRLAVYRQQYESSGPQLRVKLISKLVNLGDIAVPTLIDLSVQEEGKGAVWDALCQSIEHFGATAIPFLFNLLKDQDIETRNTGLILLNIIKIEKFEISEEQRDLLEDIAKTPQDSNCVLKRDSLQTNNIQISMSILSQLNSADDEIAKLLMRNYQYEPLWRRSLHALGHMKLKAQICQESLIAITRKENNYSRFFSLTNTLELIMTEEDFQNKFILHELLSNRPLQFKISLLGFLPHARSLTIPLILVIADEFSSQTNANNNESFQGAIKDHLKTLGKSEIELIESLHQLTDEQQEKLLRLFVSAEMGPKEQHRRPLEEQKLKIRTETNRNLIDQWIKIAPKKILERDDSK